MSEREMVSVPRDYLEALEMLENRLTAKDGVGDLRVGGNGWKLAEVFDVPLFHIARTRPKMPDAIDVLRRLATWRGEGTLAGIVADARRIIEARDKDNA